MQKISNLIFCVASLALVAAVAWLVFPYAARSSQEVQYAATPLGAEMFDDVDLNDFGMVPVLDMMQHYIDNPPPPTDPSEKKVRFQGC